MNEIVIRLIDTTTGVPLTGQAANIVIKDNGGTPITGLTVVEYGVQGNYKIYGFASWYEFVTLWVSGVQMQSFGSQAAGDPILKFINKDGTLAFVANQSMGSHKLTNLAAGTTGTDAVNFGQVVKLAGLDTITGLKSFTGGVLIDVSGNIFEIKNGAVVNLTVLNNTFTFGVSSVIISQGTALFRDPSYDPASTKYIGNIFSNTDIPSAKWVATHFAPLTGAEQNSSVIVDSSHGGIDSGRIYQTIQSAIDDITSALRVNPTDVWNIYIKPNLESIAGYVEDITLPDYINLIGEGRVIVSGQLVRGSGTGDINSKIEDMAFVIPVAATSQQVERIEGINSVFEASAVGHVVATKSKLNNCGLYGVGVTSGNNNKIINCYGNFDVVWDASTDKVYRYDFIPGDTYNN